MIEYIKLLRNIGQFDNISAGAQLPFGPFTLIYAENGRGKTTLAAIFRSLGSGLSSPINERHRVGAVHPPSVVIKSSDPVPFRYENSQWTQTLPTVAVFDDVFVAENVCSGIEIASGHRQKLHELIIGSEGVALYNAMQASIEKIEAHNQELRRRGDAIPPSARGDLSVDEFCKLKPRADVDAAITNAEMALAAARSAETVSKALAFRPLSLPTFYPDALAVLLQHDLPGLDSKAVSAVQAHLARLGGSGERWVSAGMGFADQLEQEPGSPCPFCAQDLSGSTILSHYRAYFDAAYADLKESISAALRALQREHGAEIQTAFERAVREAGEVREFWKAFAEVPPIEVDTAEVARRWKRAREAIEAALRGKQASPLEAMPLDDGTVSAISEFHEAQAAINALSGFLEEANGTIALVKERTAAADVRVLEQDLKTLRAIAARHQPETSALCAAYIEERTAKTATETARKQARAALDQYRTDVFPQYETAVNDYLRRLNASFRLSQVSSVNNRGGSSCSYALSIGTGQVPLIDDEGQPSFRSALSAGDRNTLALAFFFASLDRHPQKADAVVIIDDPMTSLDEHRSLATIQEIRLLARSVRQLIVMSHAKPFLFEIYTPIRNSCSSLKIRREGSSGSTLDVWNVSADCITEHDLRFGEVYSYIHGGARTYDDRTVAAALRPILETFLRVAYPNRFRPEMLLGPFAELCRQRLGLPDEILSAADVSELDALREYSNCFHHDTNSAWQTAAINDSELLQFARRTVEFARRA